MMMKRKIFHTQNKIVLRFNITPDLTKFIMNKNYQ